jgi:Zn-dependent M28 family amino/carboxypeptidase
MPLRLFALAFLSLPLLLLPNKQGKAQSETSGYQFTENTAIEIVAMLSSEACKGRGAGTEGAAISRSLLSSFFKQVGLQPAGSGLVNPQPAAGFHNPFPFLSEDKKDTLGGVNLVGWMPGSAYPDRFIVITAHYDHLGLMHGELHNGADDNASGAAGLVDLAFYLSQNPPKHSVLFIATDAEEPGLLGAKHWVANPGVPLENIVLNINLDMVARADNGKLWACGTRYNKALREPLMAAAEGSSLSLHFGHDARLGIFRQSWLRVSDHFPFHKAGIPFVYFGVEDHEDYHKPTDDIERIDPVVYRASLDIIRQAVVRLDQDLAGMALRAAK